MACRDPLHVTQLLSRRASRLPPIPILGETGAGKGLLARTIHQAGPRLVVPGRQS